MESITYKMMSRRKQNFTIISAETDKKLKELIKEVSEIPHDRIDNMPYGSVHLVCGNTHAIFIPNLSLEKTIELAEKYNQKVFLYKDKTGLKYYDQEGRIEREFLTEEIISDNKFNLKVLKYYFKSLENSDLLVYEPETCMGMHRAYLNAVTDSDFRLIRKDLT